MKFDFDVLGNQKFNYRSANGKEDDFRVLITWQPDPKRTPLFVLIKLSSRDHFQVWIDQLKRIKLIFAKMGRDLSNPLAGSGNTLSVQPKMLLSGSSRRLSGVAETIRGKYASSTRITGSQASLNAGTPELLHQVSFITKSFKPVFEFDVGILYNDESLPLAMTLLDLVQKEGHKAFADISAERWAGTPDLNDSGENVLLDEDNIQKYNNIFNYDSWNNIPH